MVKPSPPLYLINTAYFNYFNLYRAFRKLFILIKRREKKGFPLQFNHSLCIIIVNSCHKCVKPREYTP